MTRHDTIEWSRTRLDIAKIDNCLHLNGIFGKSIVFHPFTLASMDIIMLELHIGTSIERIECQLNLQNPSCVF